MSAYIVGLPHIDAMVALGLYGPRGVPVDPEHAWTVLSWYASDPRAALAEPADEAEHLRRLDELRRELRPETADATGEMLLAANVASVSYRYREEPTDGTLPGPVDTYYLRPYSAPRRIVHAAMPSTVEGLALLAGYEYQACEVPDWDGSEAERFVTALRSRLILRLPGWDAAPWEWTRSVRVDHGAAAGAGVSA